MKCKICGKRFKLMKENRYLATLSEHSEYQRGSSGKKQR